MTKNVFVLATLLISVVVYSQVGVNTQSPKATLDVAASPDDAAKIDGLIAPRLSGEKLQSKNSLYSSVQEGTIIYATSASPAAGTAGNKTINVDASGYYYFDGSVWVKMKGGNSIAKPFKALTGLTSGTFNFTANNNQEGVDFFEFQVDAGAITMPPATNYKNRIIYIRNIAGTAPSLSWQEPFVQNQLITTLISMRSVAFASDGIRWSQIAGF